MSPYGLALPFREIAQLAGRLAALRLCPSVLPLANLADGGLNPPRRDFGIV